MGALGQLLQKKRQEDHPSILLRHLLTPDTASAVGSTFGDVDARSADRRSKKLQELIKDGSLSIDSLGPRDKSLVGSKFLKEFINIPKPGEGDSSFLGIGGPVGESLGNFAQGAVDFGKGLPGGIAMTGASLGSDIAGQVGKVIDDPLNPNGAYGPVAPLSETLPETTKNVIDPTIQGYKEKYGQGSLGEIAHKALVEDPFGTVLDVGTIATGGAAAAGKAGSIAAKAGTAIEGATEGAGALGKLGTGLRESGNYLKQYGYKGTRGTRSPLEVGKNIEIPREFGSSPLVRTGQRLADSHLDKIPTIGQKLAHWRGKFAQHGIINTLAGREKLTGSFMAAEHSKDFVDAAKHMNDDEGLVLTLLKNGVNDMPARPRGGIERGNVSMLESFKEYLENSLAGALPKGFNIQQMTGVDPEAVKALLAKLDEPEVQALIANPSGNIVKASDEWDKAVQRNLETLPIDPAEHEQRRWAPSQALRVKPEALDKVDNASEIEAVRDPKGSFDRFSARHKAETGEEFPVKPNYIPHEIAQGEYAGNLMKIKRPEPVESVKFITDLVGKQHPKFLTESNMQAFLSGAMRVDAEPMIRQIHAREKYLAHEGLLNELSEQLAEKDRATGEVVKAKDFSEMEQKGYSRQTHTLVPLDGVIKYHQEENDAMKVVAETVEDIKRESPTEVAKRGDKILDSMHEFLDDAARKASMNVTTASSVDGIVMTKEGATHLRNSLEAMSPDTMKAARGYDRLMGYWRTALLALSPRWWINTAVGSAFLTVISGAARPRYAAAAWRYGGKGEKAARLMKLHPELKPGVYGAEVHEAEDLLVDKKHKPAQAAFKHVENMESFFKRMGFFHELDKQGKASMHQIGEVIDDFSHIGKMRDGYIDQLLEDKTFTAHAMDGVNKFYYNYASLGPIERKWVRRFVPFYGWYKFITKLMYQLPFQYPGRTLVLDKMSNIAGDFEDNELGILPPTLQGAIFLNKNRSNTEYFPTFGLNPFSDFANPAAPEGTLQGLLSSQQLAPVIGAFLKASGVDPYSGGGEELDPTDGLLEGRYGVAIDPKTGEEIPGGTGAAGFTSRFLGSLARSIPHVPQLETLLAGGRYTSPESLPLPGMIKPVPVEAGAAYDRAGGEGNYLLRSFTGVGPPETEDLRDYQEGLQEDVEYGEQKKKSQLKALRASGVQ